MSCLRCYIERLSKILPHPLGWLVGTNGICAITAVLMNMPYSRASRLHTEQRSSQDRSALHDDVDKISMGLVSSKYELWRCTWECRADCSKHIVRWWMQDSDFTGETATVKDMQCTDLILVARKHHKVTIDRLHSFIVNLTVRSGSLLCNRIVD